MFYNYYINTPFYKLLIIKIIEDEKDRLLQNLRTKIEVPKLF